MGTAGYYTRGRLISQVQAQVQNASTAARNVIANLIQSRYEEVADSYDWQELERTSEIGLRKADTAINSFVQADAYVPLPLDARRVTGLFIPSQDIKLDKVSASQLYEAMGSRINETGVPQVYAEVGVTAQYRAIATAGTVTFTASNANNDDIASVVVDYVTNTGQDAQVFSATLTGAFSTGLTIASVALGYSIQRVIVPINWDGTLAATDAGALEILKFQVLKDQTSVTVNDKTYELKRQLIRVGPVPDGNYSAVVVYQRRPRPLLDDNDTTEIPVAQYLINMAASDYLRSDRQIDLARDFERRAEVGFNRTQNAQPLRRFQSRGRGGNILSATGINPNRYK